jgi:tripartite-type tricarboxylate transporter receptor subunit TctC
MLLRRFLLTVLAFGLAAPAAAQTYPDRPIRLIAPFPAGGLADVLARAVGDEMAKTLGQPVIVENRAGAGGNTGADAVAKAPPDGYTLLMSSAGILTANPFLYTKMPFDAETAFIPVSNVAAMSMLVVVNPKVEAKTLKELVDYAKANPGKLSAGVPGIGTTAHITLEAFMADTGAKMTVVPYRAEPQMLTDLVGGQLDFACTLTTSPGPHIQAARLRALAVTSATRTQQLPDVPTVEQAGFPGFEATAWFALAAPAGTPADIIAKINTTANAFIRSAKGKEELSKLDSLPAGGTPEETKAFIAAEVRKWAPIIKAAKIQM